MNLMAPRSLSPNPAATKRIVPKSLLPLLAVFALAAGMGAAPALADAGDFGAAKWITTENKPENEKKSSLWNVYRTEFKLPVKPSHALARIAVDSKYWLWVNGELAVLEGGLKRGPTPTGTYYDEIDLAPWLRQGENTIAVLTWYWGKDGFSHKSSGQPGLLFSLTADGVTVASGGQWKGRPHPGFYEVEGEKPNYRLSESNVGFDKQNDLPGWTEPGYDSAGWPAVKVLGAPGSAPWGDLHPRSIPFWKDSGLKDYANASDFPKVSDGKPIVAKLPYNAQITPYLEVVAPAGQRISLRTDNVRIGSSPCVRAEYVTGAGRQSYESLGWMNGHEVVYDIPAGLEIVRLKYRETGYDTEFAGAFRSDDPFANKLWEKARRTLYVNMRDNYMDCPDRERAQWWGDVVIDIGETFYALSPSADQLTRKAILQLMAWQRPDKVLYSPNPGTWTKELPQQGLAGVGYYGLWTYYLYTGDRDTIVAAYPRVKDYLALWRLDKDGLVVHRKGDWDWGDWGNDVDLRVLDQAWYCLALRGAANIARLAGRPEEAEDFEKRRAALIEATNRVCWTGEAYRGPGYGHDTDDRANALCVVAGIAGPERYPAVKKVLAEKLHASPYMEKYVLEALLLMGEPDAAMVRMKKRFGPLVENNLTTLPELWAFNAGQSSTVNHAWSGGPLTLLSQYYAGLAPTSAAWKTFRVQPQMGPLSEIEAAVDTVSGKITASMQRDAATFSLNLVVPAATRASVCLPGDPGRTRKVEINGRVAWDGKAPVAGEKSVICDGVVDGRLRFQVPEGTWDFHATME
ncbi:MAG: glycoside hydrolase [Cupriavidus sp.]|nr:MAG: glycoside hydrolase [Cupriavidus sp.]